jgi:hypothetical protein
MKFVSTSGGYVININPGTQRAITHPSGVTEFMPNGDLFSAHFKLQTLSMAEITAAQEQFLGGPLGRFAFGSVPAREEGTINILDAMDEGYTSTAHDGYEPWQNLSTFDTKDPRQCPPELREEVEAYLLASNEYGRAYVRVDNYNLTPPWPTYPVTGVVDIDSIVKFAKVGGLLDAAIVYEENSGNREDLLEALNAARGVARAEAEEQAGLTARV